MKWSEQLEPERTEALRKLQDRCGLRVVLELLVRARSNDVCVWINPFTRGSIDSYLASHVVEAGGLLLGSRYELKSCGAMLSVDEFVPSRDFSGTGVSLSMGTDVWNDARPFLDAGLVVVGWVHSHPNLGAFFSSTDRKTQRAFFSKSWQIGVCVDPVRHESAWFFGPDSRSEGLVVVS